MNRKTPKQAFSRMLLMRTRFQGMMQTVWSGAGQFLDEFYGVNVNPAPGEDTATNCFKALFGK